MELKLQKPPRQVPLLDDQKKTFFGWAKGLSGKPNNKTIEDPNDPAMNKPKALL